MMTMYRTLLLLGIFVGEYLAFGQTAPPDSPQELVRLNVAATDAKGNPITDLRADDIRIREDGKERSLIFFSYAGSKNANTPAPSGQFANHPEPPTTLILFDRWNERMMTAASGWTDIETALRRQQSVENTYIYFLTSHGDLYPVRPLRGNAPQVPTTPADLVASLNEAVQKINSIRDADVRDLMLRANTTLSTLAEIGRILTLVPGRKNLIWVTHGFPFTISIGDELLNFKTQIQNLSAVLSQSEIVIYAAAEAAEQVGPEIGTETLQTLQAFSDLTGGRFYSSGRFDRVLADSLADAAGNYRAAYYSPIREKDTKPHKIRIDSLRKGVQLRTRSYAGQQPRTDDVEQFALTNECRGPFDAAEIGLRVAVSRDASKGTGHFDIAVNPADVLVERRGDGYECTLAFLPAMYTENGLQPTPPPKEIHLRFTPEQFKEASQNWIHFSADEPVSATIRKIRLMVFDRGVYGLGSVTIPVK